MAAPRCPKETELVRFVARKGEPAELAALEQHIDVCVDCRVIVAELARLRTPPADCGSDADLPLLRGACVGRYLIVRLVGVGAMGAVYEAYDPELERKVAVKILRHRVEPADASRSQRLLREARSLAKLAHSNVVAVHDVGRFGDQVFIAMEFVAGTTLGAWLAEAPRTWREVRDVFVAAARGLEAAHAAGLIHRDFKPDNVLIERGGRVLVTDFGLARSLRDRSTDDASSNSAIGDAGLTATGALVGTPLYMAPEQHRGCEPDERSDQYQFSVALLEGLVGAFPFRTGSVEALAADKGAGRIPVWPKRAKVPGWLRRAVETGLRPEPDNRHASMNAVIHALLRDQRLRTRPFHAAALVSVALAGGVFWHQSGAGERACRDSASRLASVWDAGARARIEAAFRRSGLDYAPTLLANVSKNLDAYSSEWIRQRTETCEATRVHGQQSEAMLDLRTACLDEQRESLRTLVDLLAEADAPMIQRSVQASGALADPKLCRGQELAKPVQPPDDPSMKRRLSELRVENARAHAHWLAGRFADAKKIIEPASARAHELGYQPLIAEAEYELAITRFRLGDPSGTIEALERSAWAAEAGRHDRVAAKARGWLLVPYAAKRDFVEGRRARRNAEAALTRIGGDPVLQARLDQETAVLAMHEGKYTEAVTRARTAVETWRAVHGSEHFEVATATAILGVSLLLAGDFIGASAHTRRALDQYERLLGPEHPNNAAAHVNLAHVLGRTSRHQEALAHAERALSIRQRALGPNEAPVALALATLGSALFRKGDHDSARRHFERARAIRERTTGPDSIELASSLADLASVDLQQGRDAEALARCEQARVLFENKLGREHLDVRKAWTLLGRISARQRRFKESLEHHRKSLALGQKKLGPDHVELALDLLGIGQAALALGRPSDAEQALERARSIWKAAKVDPVELAETELTLARVHERLGRPDQARSLAAAARRALELLGRGALAAEIERRLDQLHGLEPGRRGARAAVSKLALEAP
jgi:eukaryotic-like serine/threonine-protein kinase